IGDIAAAVPDASTDICRMQVVFEAMIRRLGLSSKPERRSEARLAVDRGESGSSWTRSPTAEAGEQPRGGGREGPRRSAHARPSPRRARRRRLRRQRRRRAGGAMELARVTWASCRSWVLRPVSLTGGPDMALIFGPLVPMVRVVDGSFCHGRTLT